MITKVVTTGDTGRLKVEDFTDDPDKMYVKMYAQSLSPVNINNLPWRYSIDGVQSEWKDFDFDDTTMWQRLGLVHVGNAETFILHLGDTDTTHLEGPTDLEVNLYGHVDPGTEPAIPRLAHVKDGSTYKRAEVWLNVNGVWTLTEPYVKTATGWKKIT